MRQKDRLWESEDPFLKWLRTSKGVSKTTIMHYNSYYKNFKKLKVIDQQTITHFIQNKKNNSVVRGFVSAWLQWVKENGVKMDIELPKKKSGRKRQKIVRSYTKEQINSVREKCYETKKSNGLLFDLLYYGALRISDVLTIRINSFRWDEWFDNTEQFCECIVEGKGKKQRRVLIHPRVMKVILEHFLITGMISTKMSSDDILKILQNNSQDLFNNMTEWKVWDIIHRMSGKVLKTPMRPHEIRHARATELQDMGVNIRDIQHYLGHSTPNITEIYLHTTSKTSLKHIREIVEK